MPDTYLISTWGAPQCFLGSTLLAAVELGTAEHRQKVSILPGSTGCFSFPASPLAPLAERETLAVLAGAASLSGKQNSVLVFGLNAIKRCLRGAVEGNWF